MHYENSKNKLVPPRLASTSAKSPILPQRIEDRIRLSEAHRIVPTSSTWFTVSTDIIASFISIIDLAYRPHRPRRIGPIGYIVSVTSLTVGATILSRHSSTSTVALITAS